MARRVREIRSVRQLPHEQYEDYGDIPPEGMGLDDVELIWWAVASRMSKKEIRKNLMQVADGYLDKGCFRYCRIRGVKWCCPCERRRNSRRLARPFSLWNVATTYLELTVVSTQNRPSCSALMMSEVRIR
jgi:hypothetical protein